MVNNTPVSQLGCTIVIREDDMNISSSNFFNIPIEARLVRSENGSQIVLVDSLVKALQDYIMAHPTFPVNPSVLQALWANNDTHSQYNWATSQVLEFGRSMEDPSHGFRVLAPNIPQVDGPTIGANNSGHILLSVMPADWRLLSFERTWSHFGFNSHSHFIIIFLHKEHHNYFLPLQSQIANQGFPAILDNPSQANAQAYAPMTFPNVYERQPHHDRLRTSLGADVAAFSSLEDLLDYLPIGDFDVQNARFLEAETESHLPLVVMVLNWRSMSNVLNVLGLDVKSSDRKLTVELGGNLCNLSALDVLEHFNWGSVSFTHKTLWYRWAFGAAHKKWVNPLIYSVDPKIRSQISKQEGHLFKLWRGVCFLFKPGGAIDRGITPIKQSNDFDELQAVTLSQSNIRKYKAAISRYLTN